MKVSLARSEEAKPLSEAMGVSIPLAEEVQTQAKNNLLASDTQRRCFETIYCEFIYPINWPRWVHMMVHMMAPRYIKPRLARGYGLRQWMEFVQRLTMLIISVRLHGNDLIRLEVIRGLLTPTISAAYRRDRDWDCSPKLHFFCEKFWSLLYTDMEVVSTLIDDVIRLLRLKDSLPLAAMVVRELRGIQLPLDLSSGKERIMNGTADLQAKISEIKAVTLADCYDPLWEQAEGIMQEVELSRAETLLC